MVKPDNTISQNSNNIGVGSISFFGDSFFIHFFTQNNMFFSEKDVGFLKICLLLLLVSTMTIYGITTNYRGINTIRWSFLPISVVSQFSNLERFWEYILSAALSIFISKEDFVIFLLSSCLASSTFRKFWNILNSLRSVRFLTYIKLNIWKNLDFMDQVNSNTVPTIFLNKLKKPTHNYSTDFARTNYSILLFRLNKSKYRLSIRGPTLWKNIRTDTEKNNE